MQNASFIMARILIVYSSPNGHTSKIAGVIANQLEGDGHRVDLFEAKRALREQVHPASYDGILVGAPVYNSRYPWPLRAWCKRHGELLTLMPSRFFSVCLGILQDDRPAVRQAEERIAETFFRRTQWQPWDWKIFAGALSYTQYGPITRWFMKRLAKSTGRSTDTKRDTDYTDWNSVTDFARTFSESLKKSPALKSREQRPA